MLTSRAGGHGKEHPSITSLSGTVPAARSVPPGGGFSAFLSSLLESMKVEAGFLLPI